MKFCESPDKVVWARLSNVCRSKSTQRKKKKKVIIETLVSLQTVFKQHYKPDSKHEISESLIFFLFSKKQPTQELIFFLAKENIFEARRIALFSQSGTNQSQISPQNVCSPSSFQASILGDLLGHSGC